MKNKKNWVLILGVMVVVVALASFVTLQISGNVVKMANPNKAACERECRADKCTGLSTRTNPTVTKCRSDCTTSCANVQFYTKEEVDAIISTIKGKCCTYNPADTNKDWRINGTEISVYLQKAKNGLVGDFDWLKANDIYMKGEVYC